MQPSCPYLDQLSLGLADANWKVLKLSSVSQFNIPQATETANYFDEVFLQIKTLCDKQTLGDSHCCHHLINQRKYYFQNVPQQAARGGVGGRIYFTGKIIKEWDTARGLQVNGRFDICQCQWHTRSQSGSIPPREPKDHGQLIVMLQNISMSYLVFFHGIEELDVKPTHILLCCKPVIVSVEKCEL